MSTRGGVVVLIFALLLFAGWKYSGPKEVEIKAYTDGILTMTNGSAWLVFEADRYRAEKWEKGDNVKLIYSKGFYAYEYLGLNLYLNDVVHLHCVGDGK